MARLGTVGPSRVQLVAPQPRQADLFGGLQSALGRRQTALLTNEDTANAVEDAELQRDLKLARSRALVGLSDTKARIELEQAELAKAYDPAGVDFRKRSDEITDRYMGEFRSTLPPDLQPEFDPEIAVYRNNRSATAYNTQYEMEGANYKGGLADLQKKALDSIFLGNSTIDDWTPVLQNYFDNSPLSEIETEALIAETNRNLESMEFARQAEDETTNWIQYPGATADGMPQGMPGYAVGLLGAVSATESGGAYNVINGGETFSDFSDHPRRRGAGGTSTAAGKYQFIEDTWDAAARALNLPDFSPASQEKAAWWLAVVDYSRRTGRNLEADLASGDPVMIENVRKVLGGRGEEDVTWQGLQHLPRKSSTPMSPGARQSRPAS
ncbi:MAG: glycoside hydrolase family 104 protein [Candidatus Competibacteraceae bacterium]|nr:glycoside hydrolase family 104 protein [Candidatus Competibacteraceae bacterium]